MKIGVLGTGIVGQTLSEGLAARDHDVMIGTRDVQAALARTTSEQAWVPAFGVWHDENPDVKVGTFSEAAAHGEVVVNATAGGASLDALSSAGAANLNGKILIDVANALDFSGGMPPTLSVANTDSLGEQIQRAFPEAKVVKTLNTVSALVMVAPAAVAGADHHVFVSGDDADAKAQVGGWLGEWFGWQNVIDLGGISSARGPEMYLTLWLGLMGSTGSPMFNMKIVT
jgi:8-hydroxy-5-deazaflavin:NADPH oxidoreductase